MADSLFNKFKMLIGMEDMELMDYESEDSSAAETQITEGTLARRVAPAPKNDYYNKPVVEPNGNKVVRMQSNQSLKSQQMKLMLIEPKDFNECPKLVDCIKNNRPVIVNLESLDGDKARRIFDFLSGSVYALGGCMRKVANNIFVIAPENVDVLAEDAENTLASKSSAGGMWHK